MSRNYNTASGISGTVLATVTVGALLAYSGLRGKNISSVFRQFIKGGNPAAVPTTATVAISGVYADPNSTSGLAAADAATPGILARGTDRRGIVVSAANSQLGKPYVWDTPLNAANPSPASFDCSGLTMWCYYQAGVRLQHQTSAQFAQLQHAPFSSVQPGDLIFYALHGVIYHVAIYVGNGSVIEAPEVGIPVRVRTINASDSDLVSTVGVLPGG